ncbi:MAG: hypothetical protein ACOZBH_03135 [Patescibacteria group bacterium]
MVAEPATVVDTDLSLCEQCDRALVCAVCGRRLCHPIDAVNCFAAERYSSLFESECVDCYESYQEALRSWTCFSFGISPRRSDQNLKLIKQDT